MQASLRCVLKMHPPPKFEDACLRHWWGCSHPQVVFLGAVGIVSACYELKFDATAMHYKRPEHLQVPYTLPKVCMCAKHALAV